MVTAASVRVAELQRTDIIESLSVSTSTGIGHDSSQVAGTNLGSRRRRPRIRSLCSRGVVGGTVTDSTRGRSEVVWNTGSTVSQVPS
jgi:hypothetical protein